MRRWGRALRIIMEGATALARHAEPDTTNCAKARVSVARNAQVTQSPPRRDARAQPGQAATAFATGDLDTALKYTPPAQALRTATEIWSIATIQRPSKPRQLPYGAGRTSSLTPRVSVPGIQDADRRPSVWRLHAAHASISGTQLALIPYLEHQ